MANAIAARLDRHADRETDRQTDNGDRHGHTDTAGVCAVRANNAHCLISLLKTREKRRE